MILISVEGEVTPQIQRLIDRPIAKRHHVELEAFSLTDYKIETERLVADLPSPTILDGLPDPDPVGTTTTWRNGVFKILRADGSVQYEEPQQQAPIEELITEIDNIAALYPNQTTITMSGVPLSLQQVAGDDWADYLNAPGAIISAQPNGLSSIQVEVAATDQSPPLKATVVFHKISDRVIFDAVQLFDPATLEPLSSTLYKYALSADSTLTILGYETRTPIDLGDGLTGTQLVISELENFTLTISGL